MNAMLPSRETGPTPVWEGKLRRFLNAAENLAICLAGGAFIGLGISSLIFNSWWAGALLGGLSGFIFWFMNPKTNTRS